MLDPISGNIGTLKILMLLCSKHFSQMLSVPLSTKFTDAHTEVKLKIPQLTFGDLAQIEFEFEFDKCLLQVYGT